MLSVVKVIAPGPDGVVKDSNTKAIPLTLPAILGRGPLLKCAETKVSRRHATLDWDDDGILIQAEHINPTFVMSSGQQSILKSGQSVILKHGDLFGLLPKCAWYRVILSDSGPSSNGVNLTSSSEKGIQENEVTLAPAASVACVDDTSKVAGKTLAVNGNDKDEENNAMLLHSGQSADDKLADNTRQSLDAKSDDNLTTVSEHKNGTTSGAVESCAVADDKKITIDQTADQKEPDDKKMTVDKTTYETGVLGTQLNQPQQAPRIRTLPDWITSLPTFGTADTPSAAVPAKPGKRGRPNAKQTGATAPKRARATGKLAVKKKTNAKEDLSSSDSDDCTLPSPTPANNKNKYITVNKKENLKRNDISSSDEEQDSSCTKNTTKNSAKKSPAKNKLNVRKDMSSSDDDDNVTPAQSTVTKRPASRQATPDKSASGHSSTKSSPIGVTANADAMHKMSDSEDEDVKSNQQTSNGEAASSPCGDANNDGASGTAGGASSRLSCSYGAACYRRNPQHRVDEAHPGDPDYISLSDLPECEYGVDCYRRSKQHKQAYKHTQLPQRRARKKARAAARQGAGYEEGDSEDSYDYDDPFLDDGTSDEYAPTDSDDSGSEYYPSQPLNDEERKNVKRMNKEANKFIKKRH